LCSKCDAYFPTKIVTELHFNKDHPNTDSLYSTNETEECQRLQEWDRAARFDDMSNEDEQFQEMIQQSTIDEKARIELEDKELEKERFLELQKEHQKQQNDIEETLRKGKESNPEKSIEGQMNEFVCNICDHTAFNREVRYKLHLKTHLHFTETKKHGNGTSKPSITCLYCDKSFDAKEIFKSHLETHSDINPYKCHPCEYASYKRSNVVQHCTQKHRRKGTDNDIIIDETKKEALSQWVDDEVDQIMLDTGIELKDTIKKKG
jgi:hypothetical protein